MKILNVGLMIDSPTNGFQEAMIKVATGGYRDLNCRGVNFNRDLLSLAESFRPDLIFLQIQTPNILDISVARRLAEISFVMQWNGDIRKTTPDWGIELGKIIQLTTYSNMRDVYTTRSYGVASDFLQVGIDPKRYNKHPKDLSVAPIVFMGNNYVDIYPKSRERSDMVNRLRAEFGNNFAVYGNGWWPSNGSLMNDQTNESRHYCSSRIAINQNHFVEERFTSDRMFRALASGVLVISHRYPGMDDDFSIGEHLVVYEDFNDLINKCNYYLSNETERSKIAEAGYNHCHKNFTFDNMCQNIVKLYDKYKIPS